MAHQAARSSALVLSAWNICCQHLQHFFREICLLVDRRQPVLHRELHQRRYRAHFVANLRANQAVLVHYPEYASEVDISTDRSPHPSGSAVRRQASPSVTKFLLNVVPVPESARTTASPFEKPELDNPVLAGNPEARNSNGQSDFGFSSSDVRYFEKLTS